MTLSVHKRTPPARLLQTARTSSAPAVPVIPAPHALSLEALGSGGLPLDIPPLMVSQHIHTPEVQTLTALIQAGFLPALPPKRNESLWNYVTRISHPLRPHGFNLQVIPCEVDDVESHRLAPIPGELTISLEYAPEPVILDAQLMRKELGRLHPRFFGSLMVHLSRITAGVWPVYTAYDAIETAMYWRFQTDGDPAEFWQEKAREFQNDRGRVPVGQELREFVELHHATPRQLYRLIGLDEVLPTLDHQLCFSMQELWSSASASTLPWKTHLLALLEQLDALKALNSHICLQLTERERIVQRTTGENRCRPVAAISGQRVTCNEIHEVGELLCEEEQIADATGGFFEPFILLVHDAPSAQHCVELLGLLRRSLDLTTSVLDAITD